MRKEIRHLIDVMNSLINEQPIPSNIYKKEENHENEG